MSSNRLHYIDWLRVIAFGILILFHCAVPFVEYYTWEINSDQTSKAITRIIWWTHQWRLPLLFFVAGVAVRFSLFKRTLIGFYKERFIRLFIPLWFAIFFITPIQVYFDWLQKGRISESFIQFYPSVLEIVPYPDGAFTWSHMWFVAYLFVFTLLLIPVFAISRKRYLAQKKFDISPVFKSPLGHIILSVPSMLFIKYLFVDWPEQGSLIDDWYVFSSSIYFYFIGFLMSSFSSFWDGCLKYRRLFLIIAISCSIYLVSIYFWNWHLSKPSEDGRALNLFAIVNGLHIWAIILTCIGFSMKYLNYRSERLMYFNKTIYPLYVLHQAAIVSFGYYILQWNTSIYIMLATILILTLLTSLSLYEYVIRRNKLTRLLFGMKWNSR